MVLVISDYPRMQDSSPSNQSSLKLIPRRPSVYRCLFCLVIISFLILPLDAKADPTASPPATAPAATTQQAPDPGPTFTLHLDSGNPEDMFQAFSNSTHFTFAETSPGFWTQENWPHPAPLNIEKKPFWVALASLQDALKITFAADESGEHVTPSHDTGDWGWTNRPEATAGPLLLSVRHIQRRTTVPYADPSQSFDTITITMQGIMQPDSGWAIEPQGMELQALTTSAGASLPLKTNPLRLESTVIKGRTRYSFSAFAESSRKIDSVTLSGTLHCIGSAEQESIEIANAESTTLDKNIGGIAVHLSTRRTAAGVEVHLSTTLPPNPGPNASAAIHKQLFQLLEGRIKMFDANDIELTARPMFVRSQRRRGTSQSSTPGQLEVSSIFTPPDGPTPYHAVWTIPTGTSSASFPFQIIEIPLP